MAVYHHPDVVHAKRQVLNRIVIACCLWAAVFLYAIHGD